MRAPDANQTSNGVRLAVDTKVMRSPAFDIAPPH